MYNQVTKLHSRAFTYVKFNPAMGRALGSNNAAILLQRFLDIDDSIKRSQKHFYRTAETLCQELNLGMAEFRAAKSILVSRGVVTVSRKGMDPKHYYEINWDGMTALVFELCGAERAADLAGDAFTEEPDADEDGGSQCPKGQRATAQKGNGQSLDFEPVADAETEAPQVRSEHLRKCDNRVQNTVDKKKTNKEDKILGVVPTQEVSPKRVKRELPTLAQVREYALEIGLPESEADACYWYYDSLEWKRSGGKVPVTKWRSVVSGWKARSKPKPKQAAQVSGPAQERLASDDVLDRMNQAWRMGDEGGAW